MSSLSNGEFQNLDVCGNLATQNLTSANGASLGSSASSFTFVQGTLFATGNSQFTQGATYGGDSVFQQRVTVSDLTLSNNFVAQGDATYQGDMQTEADLNAFGKNVNIGKNTSNETRLFIKTIEPVLMEADLDVCGNIVAQNLTVDGSLNIGPNSIPATAIAGQVVGADGSTGPIGPTGETGVGIKGDKGALGPTGIQGNKGSVGDRGEAFKVDEFNLTIDTNGTELSFIQNGPHQQIGGALPIWTFFYVFS